MDEKIFDRVEKKYLIDQATKQDLLKTIEQYMDRDGYYKSRVYNIYFDTDNFDLIIKSIERPKFKEKLRARSYGGYDKVFLEIKTKMKGREYNRGYKRRVLITTKDYQELIKGSSSVKELAGRDIETPRDLQIASEVDYFISHRELSPRILVYYDRTSYIGDRKLRITFDENLSYRNHDLDFTTRKKDRKYFNDKKDIIMEIKAHGVLPLWLVRTLSRDQVYPQQFSKIGKVYEQIIKEERSK